MPLKYISEEIIIDVFREHPFEVDFKNRFFKNLSSHTQQHIIERLAVSSFQIDTTNIYFENEQNIANSLALITGEIGEIKEGSHLQKIKTDLKSKSGLAVTQIKEKQKSKENNPSKKR